MQIQVRFNDTDALGHVNNAAYAHYAELGRLYFLRSLEVEVGKLILARLELDFRRQVKFGDDVSVETAVERIGNSSIHVGQKIFAGDEIAAEVKSVVVYFDYESGRAVRIPDQFREKLGFPD
jgi:acyl-CoA thioester hydrolase